MSRRKFIESHGATCKNWNWSWSFVNHAERFVIFGAWDDFEESGRSIIMNQNWEYYTGNRRQPGYGQAIEHLRLIEAEGYGLKTFRMIKSKDGQPGEPAKIAGFEWKLTDRQMVRDGDAWCAI